MSCWTGPEAYLNNIKDENILYQSYFHCCCIEFERIRDGSFKMLNTTSEVPRIFTYRVLERKRKYECKDKELYLIASSRSGREKEERRDKYQVE